MSESENPPPKSSDETLYELEGLLRGIWMDGVVTPSEVKSLTQWCASHADLENIPPYDRILPRLRAVLEDGVYLPEEHEDILWIIEGYKMSSDYLGGAAADAGELEGVLKGILADGEISLKELRGLQEWLHFKRKGSTKPAFPEIERAVDNILGLGEVGDRQLTMLRTYFEGFLARLHKNKNGR